MKTCINDWPTISLISSSLHILQTAAVRTSFRRKDFWDCFCWQCNWLLWLPWIPSTKQSVALKPFTLFSLDHGLGNYGVWNPKTHQCSNNWRWMRFIHGNFTTFLQNTGQSGNRKVVKYQELYLSDTSLYSYFLNLSPLWLLSRGGWYSV